MGTKCHNFRTRKTIISLGTFQYFIIVICNIIIMNQFWYTPRQESCTKVVFFNNNTVYKKKKKIYISVLLPLSIY